MTDTGKGRPSGSPLGTPLGTWKDENHPKSPMPLWQTGREAAQGAPFVTESFSFMESGQPTKMIQRGNNQANIFLSTDF